MIMAFDPRRVTGRPGPQRALRMGFSFRWHHPRPAFLLDMDGTGSWNERVLTEAIDLQEVNWRGGNPALLDKENFDTSAVLAIPMSAEAIRCIEQHRQQSDISLRLMLRYRWQEAFPRQRPKEVAEGQPEEGYLTGAVLWTQVEHSVTIAHSDWLRYLEQMQWGQTELFEVAALPLREDPNLSEALRLLRDAETAFRAGDWKGVLAKCREAFESAAKYEAQSSNLPLGYTKLLERAFPDEESKRTRLNSLIQGLSEYAHLGRHASFPALHIGREEAEFILTAALGLFSMISRRMA
jgi:hypothetical protein